MFKIGLAILDMREAQILEASDPGSISEAIKRPFSEEEGTELLNVRFYIYVNQ